jgi:hypothetical protein
MGQYFGRVRGRTAPPPESFDFSDSATVCETWVEISWKKQSYETVWRVS